MKLSMAKFVLDSSLVVTMVEFRRLVMMWDLEDWGLSMPFLILFGGYSWISKKRPSVTQIPLLWLEMFEEVESAADKSQEGEESRSNFVIFILPI
jgi:hypothetical protein